MNCKSLLASLKSTFGSRPDNTTSVHKSLKDVKTKAGYKPILYVLTYTGPPDSHGDKAYRCTDRTSVSVGVDPVWLSNMKEKNESYPLDYRSGSGYVIHITDKDLIRGTCQRGFRFHRHFINEIESEVEVQMKKSEALQNGCTTDRDHLAAVSRARSVLLDDEEYGPPEDMAHVPFDDYETFLNATDSLVAPTTELSVEDVRWAAKVQWSANRQREEAKRGRERSVEGQSQDDTVRDS